MDPNLHRGSRRGWCENSGLVNWLGLLAEIGVMVPELLTPKDRLILWKILKSQMNELIIQSTLVSEFY